MLTQEQMNHWLADKAIQEERMVAEIQRVLQQIKAL